MTEVEDNAYVAFWELMAIEKRRVWWSSWPYLSRLVGIGGDEYLRRTLWIGPLVIALWRCRCDDCLLYLSNLRREVDRPQADPRDA